MSSDRDEILQHLMEEVKKLKRQMNQLTTPPHISKVLDYIRQVKVTNMKELRTRFNLYGGSASRFYQTIKNKPDEFITISGASRWSSMTIAHLTNGKPTTPNTIAVHILANTKPGKTISIQRIMEEYNLTPEKTRLVYDEIINIFPRRTNAPARPIDHYKLPIKRRY